VQANIPICAGNFLPRRGIVTCFGGAMDRLTVAARDDGDGG